MSLSKLDQPLSKEPLLASEKQQLCLLKAKDPGLKQHQLVAHAASQFGKEVSLSAVQRMLSKKDEYLSFHNDGKDRRRIKAARWPQMETALEIWLRQMQRSGKEITNGAIKSKALDLARGMGIPAAEFTATSGWIQLFKRRKGLAVSGKLELTNEPLETMVDVTSTCVADYIKSKGYNAGDCYSFTETTLLYGALPAKHGSQASRLNKDSVTVGLTANADGSDALTPLVISDEKASTCFAKDFSPEVYVDHYQNQKACMTAEVFQEWLTKLNGTVTSIGRRILLIVEGTPAHSLKEGLTGESYGLQTLELSNVTVLYIPSKPSLIMPLSSGVTSSFKALYRARLLKFLVDSTQHMEAEDGLEVKPTLEQAIPWIKEALVQVTSAAITNGWRQSGFLPLEFTAAWPLETEYLLNLEENIAKVALNLKLEPLSSNEYINMAAEGHVEELLDDARLIAYAQESESKVQAVKLKRPQERRPRQPTAAGHATGLDLGKTDPQLAGLAEARRSADVLAAFMASDPQTFSPEVQLRFQSEVAGKVTKLTISSLMKRQRDPAEENLSLANKSQRIEKTQQEEAAPQKATGNSEAASS